MSDPKAPKIEEPVIINKVSGVFWGIFVVAMLGIFGGVGWYSYHHQPAKAAEAKPETAASDEAATAIKKPAKKPKVASPGFEEKTVICPIQNIPWATGIVPIQISAPVTNVDLKLNEWTDAYTAPGWASKIHADFTGNVVEFWLSSGEQVRIYNCRDPNILNKVFEGKVPSRTFRIRDCGAAGPASINFSK